MTPLERARWTAQPAYLGWLGLLLEQNLRSLSRDTPLPAEALPKVEEVRDAVLFLERPDLQDGCQRILERLRHATFRHLLAHHHDLLQELGSPSSP